MFWHIIIRIIWIPCVNWTQLAHCHPVKKHRWARLAHSLSSLHIGGGRDSIPKTSSELDVLHDAKRDSNLWLVAKCQNACCRDVSPCARTAEVWDEYRVASNQCTWLVGQLSENEPGTIQRPSVYCSYLVGVTTTPLGSHHLFPVTSNSFGMPPICPQPTISLRPYVDHWGDCLRPSMTRQ